VPVAGQQITAVKRTGRANKQCSQPPPLPSYMFILVGDTSYGLHFAQEEKSFFQSRLRNDDTFDYLPLENPADPGHGKMKNVFQLRGDRVGFMLDALTGLTGLTGSIFGPQIHNITAQSGDV